MKSILDRSFRYIPSHATDVRKTFERYWGEMRFGNLLVMCQFGTLPADLTRSNMERFARGVMPALKILH